MSVILNQAQRSRAIPRHPLQLNVAGFLDRVRKSGN
jgi:hypothetical protein